MIPSSLLSQIDPSRWERFASGKYEGLTSIGQRLQDRCDSSLACLIDSAEPGDFITRAEHEAIRAALPESAKYRWKGESHKRREAARRNITAWNTSRPKSMTPGAIHMREWRAKHPKSAGETTVVR